jgi:hypothetical protein
MVIEGVLLKPKLQSPRQRITSPVMSAWMKSV